MASQDTNGETRVMIVDSEALACQGLAALMASTDDLTVVAATTDAQEAIDLAKRKRPHVAIVDPGLPGLVRLEVVSQISTNDRTRVIFLDTDPATSWFN